MQISRSIISNLFLALAVLLLAGPAYQAALWLLEPEAKAAASVDGESAATQPAERLLTSDIQHIRVGQRVLADDPDVEVSTRTRVDPETWKQVTLESIWHWPDGTRDDVRVVTLVPPEWLAAFEVEVGRSAPLPLDLVEMGLPETLTAKVLAIERCPPLAAGPGRVVLTTVNHLHCDVHTLTLRDATGRERTVHPTGGHRFYRARDRAWVHLRDLRVGDELGGLDAPVTVADIAPLPGARRVYNLTVEGEHVYYVSQLAALAHNVCPANAPRSGGVQANKLSGDAIRDAIAAREAPALVEQTFTTVGGVRRVDVLKLGDQTLGIESKVVRTALDSRVRQELARDWWLRRQGQVGGIRWEFTPSQVTGEVGPTGPLLQKLQKLGFDVKVNP